MIEYIRLQYGWFLWDSWFLDKTALFNGLPEYCADA